MLQVVAALPAGRKRGEPFDAFAAAPLHLHHMGDGMCSPEIAGIELDGAPPARLGSEIVARLFQREATAGEDRRIARRLLRPGRHHALDGGDHVLRAAEPEVDEVCETERDDIVWMGAQDRFPHGDGPVEVAFGPCGQGGDVTALALCCLGGQRLRGARRLDGGRHRCLLEGKHREVALHAMRQRKVRVGLQHAVQAGGCIGPVGEVTRDEMVIGRGSLGAGRREREASGVEMHVLILSACRGRPARSRRA